MKNKIEHAVLKLKKNVEKHKTFSIVKSEGEILKINDSSTEFWVTFLFVMFLIIMPIGFLINEVLFEKDKLIIGLLILCISSFIYKLYKVVIGGTTLNIDLQGEQFTIENKHILFNKILKTKTINFDQVAKTELKEESIKNKYGSSKWLRLSIIDKNGKKNILTDFRNEYPESSIASDVKNVIDATIIKN